ncbi:hypothetical protein F5B19DRAFT_473182 [Rostrohypoxylon terebratum]|nr:hypothetical protein F5B19DRAFT_473182 [Rostrohypoxylon terebratum]
MPRYRHIQPADQRTILHTPSQPNNNQKIKVRRQHHSDREWEHIKPIAHWLYIRMGFSLDDTMSTIMIEEGFQVGKRKWKMMLDRWGFTKYAERTKVSVSGADWWPSTGETNKVTSSIPRACPIISYPELDSLPIVKGASITVPVSKIPIEMSLISTQSRATHLRWPLNDKYMLCYSQISLGVDDEKQIISQMLEASHTFSRLYLSPFKSRPSRQQRIRSKCFWTAIPRNRDIFSKAREDFLDTVMGLPLFRSILERLGHDNCERYHLRNWDEQYLISITERVFRSENFMEESWFSGLPRDEDCDFFLLFKTRHRPDLMLRITVPSPTRLNRSCREPYLEFNFYSDAGAIAFTLPILTSIQLAYTLCEPVVLPTTVSTGLWKDLTNF